MESLNIQSLIGLAVLIGCSVYALRACFQLLWTGAKLSVAVVVGIMVLDLTMPSVKPYINAQTSGQIESALSEVRSYVHLIAATTNQRVISIPATTKS